MTRRAVGWLVVAVVLAVPLLWLGPFVADDLALDRIVKVVALDWRDFGETRARERLQYEMDHHRIGLQVRDRDCQLETVGAVRRVRCAWQVPVPVPVAALVPLAFSSEASILPDGDVTP